MQASSVWLAMHGKEVPRPFRWTGKSLFSWAAMPSPLTMCPAREEINFPIGQMAGKGTSHGFRG